MHPNWTSYHCRGRVHYLYVNAVKKIRHLDIKMVRTTKFIFLRFWVQNNKNASQAILSINTDNFLKQ
jgi:hypothetical protein